MTTGYRASRAEHVVSRGLDLTTYSGELIVLMGPNGSGKSTLMQTIAGLLRPLSGEVNIAGHPIQNIKDKERAKLMSLVLTERIEHTNLTVWDIITTGRYPYLGQRGKLRPDDIDILQYCLKLCNLQTMAQRRFSELSDGEKQRVMIARALAQETPLMLLDEPTAHLDLPSRLEVLTMLRRLARELGKSILVSTHELDLALQWADGIWLFDRGGGVCAGAPEELVLSGDIERVFGNERLHFDPSSGEFRLITNNQQALRLSAEGITLAWATRALQRMGYDVVSDSQVHCPIVEAHKLGWLLRCHGHEFIAHNLSDLQKLLYDRYPIQV
ncbi:MAG: ABC transporter ATP-binding protein [Porphyromonadaceae bacterium]|nr:ABC transporter ATP-binding protein [Porphyromonadaceae bacterium]